MGKVAVPVESGVRVARVAPVRVSVRVMGERTALSSEVRTAVKVTDWLTVPDVAVTVTTLLPVEAGAGPAICPPVVMLRPAGSPDAV